MKIGRSVTAPALVLIILALSGCAAAPKHMSADDVARIECIGVSTYLESSSPKNIDLTGIRQQEYKKTYGGMMYGAVGGALEAIAIEIIARKKISSQIGGSLSAVRDSLSEFNAAEVFDDVFYRAFSEEMKANGKAETVILLRENQDKQSPEGVPNADTLVRISYQYGIGAFGKGHPIPALAAQISVVAAGDNKTLMQDTLTVHACEEKDYSLADYAKEDGRLYKECFQEMAEQFGRRLVGRYF